MIRRTTTSAIDLDDLLLPRLHQRHVAEVLADAARQRLGTYTDGRFTPAAGHEARAADYIQSSLEHAAEAMADRLDAMRTAS